MRMLQSVGKLVQTPAWRPTRPKDHEIGGVRPVFADGEYCAEIIDRQFFPSRRKMAVLALRWRLRGVIVKEQAPGRRSRQDLAHSRRRAPHGPPHRIDLARDLPQ